MAEFEEIGIVGHRPAVKESVGERSLHTSSHQAAKRTVTSSPKRETAELPEGIWEALVSFWEVRWAFEERNRWRQRKQDRPREQSQT